MKPNYIARVKKKTEDYIYRKSLRDKFQVASPPTSQLSCWRGFSTENLVPDVLVALTSILKTDLNHSPGKNSTKEIIGLEVKVAPKLLAINDMTPTARVNNLLVWDLTFSDTI